MHKYDMVIFGNYTKDTIVSSAGTRYVDGGGFNYGAHAAKIAGLRIAAVTRLAKEDSHVVKNLEKIGIDVYPTFTRNSTHMRLEYPTDNPDERILICDRTAGTYIIEQFENLAATAFLINGSIREEVPLDLVKCLRNKAEYLVADAQTFIRIVSSNHQLIHADWPEKEKILAYIDVLKADAVEAESLTGESDIKKAAKILSALGPKEVVITQRNGMMVYADQTCLEAPFLPEKVIGRIVRGDTCIASYMSRRLTADPHDAMIWSAAVTSLKMEKEGPILVEKHEVEEVIKKKYQNY
ncbi:MAG: hypothetical protein E4H13_03020 [Calditrichales bacterium]|nr:MAG: hypothetical protein E4H13_03020 [Calditrichales bacterium]